MQWKWEKQTNKKRQGRKKNEWMNEWMNERKYSRNEKNGRDGMKRKF